MARRPLYFIYVTITNRFGQMFYFSKMNRFSDRKLHKVFDVSEGANNINDDDMNSAYVDILFVEYNEND